MAATLSTPPAPITDPVWRLSVDQYHAMIDSGILNENTPVELVEGILLEKMPQNPPHSFVTDAVRSALAALVPDAYVRAQAPITLPDSEPEPDVVVAVGARRQFFHRHPGATDIALVVEISDSTLVTDRGIKQRIYARAGIPEYWIADLNARRTEVRTNPQGDSYRTLTFYSFDDPIPVRIGGGEKGALRIASLIA